MMGQQYNISNKQWWKPTWKLMLCLVLVIGAVITTKAQDKMDLYSEARVQELDLRKSNSELLKQQVTLRYDQVSIEKLLAYLEQKKNIRFSYNKELLAGNPRVTLNLKEVSLSEALDKTFENTSIQYYAFEDGYIVLRERYFKEAAQIEAITGTVTDAQSGETLPGVNVMIKGTTTGTSTGSEGNYELDAPSLQDTLVFSFVGYQTREVPIEGRTAIDIGLEPEAIEGEEMVVVGYGTQQQKDIISGISTVNTEDLNLSDLNTPDPANLLKGRVSGVRIQEGTGAAGSAPIIRIRGTSSVNAGVEPLVVVDGFPVGTGFPQTLNPDDIENITVLKDASATAIYGARGSNGVVLIETKEARSGMSEFGYNSSFSIQQLPDNWRPEMLNAEEAVKYNIERIQELDDFNNVSNPTSIPQRFLDAQEALEKGELSSHGYDWLDEFIEEGMSSFSQNHNITYRTGNENFRAAVSGGFLDEKSALPADDFERISLRTNFNADLSESIGMEMNLNGVRTVNNRIPSNGPRSGLWAAITGSPLISPYDEEGNLIPFVPGDAQGFFARPNPIFQAREELDEQVNRDLQATINFNVEIAEGLHYEPRFYARQLTEEIEQFQPSTIGDVSIAGADDLYRGEPPQNNNGMNQFFELENWGLDNIIRYTKSLENHDLDITLGQTIQKEKAVQDQINGSLFPSDGIVNYAEAGEITGNSSDYEWSLLAGFGRIEYDYQDKYLAEFNFRREGSSRLGENNRFGNFPSGALGWRVSNEEFFPDNFFNELLFRGSLGKTGNNAIGNFDALGTFASSRSVIGDDIQEAKFLSTFSNRNLAWETAIQWQIGATLGMINNRINVDIEYWEKNTEDMLFNVNTPGASGFESTRLNIGEMKNKGLDVTINTFRELGKGFQWNSNLNISWTTNKVTKMPEQIDRLRFGDRGGTNVVQEGDEVGAFWGLIREGLFNEETANDPNTANFEGLSKIPGTNHYRDLNGDGVIDRDNDMTVIGSPHPDVILGLNNQLSYQSFSFSVLLTSMLGYQIMPRLRDVDLNQVARWNVSKLVLDRWQSPEDPGNGFVPRSEVNANSREWMDDWLESGDHLWIKNIRISYSMPPNMVETLGMSQVRFIFTVDNVARFDSYSGFNPEVTSGSTVEPGNDHFVNPLTRSFSLGVNLTF